MMRIALGVLMVLFVGSVTIGVVSMLPKEHPRPRTAKTIAYEERTKTLNALRRHGVKW